MAFRVAFCAAVVLVSAISVNGYGSGAPPVDSTCKNLSPAHNKMSAQNGVPPYDFSLSNNNVKAGDRVVVTISKQSSGPGFQGFLLQARKVNGGTAAVGKWVPQAGVSKGVSCSQVENSSLTHSDKAEKSQVTAEWVAPGPGQYEIYHTVLENYGGRHWTGHKSQTITVS